jgi:hypothetical protein
MIVKVGKALNRYDEAFNVIEALVTTFRQTGRNRHIVKLNGWTKCQYLSNCDIVPVYQINGSGWCFGSNTNCIGGQAYQTENLHPLGTAPPPIVWPQTAQSLLWASAKTHNDARVTHVALFARMNTAWNELVPDYRGTYRVLTKDVQVTVVETLDAFLLPIQSPGSTRQAVGWAQIPRRQMLLKRDPLEQYQRGYGTTLDVRNRRDVVSPNPQPDRLVVEVPVVGSPVLVPPSTVPPHVAGPPRAGTKEHKLMMVATGRVKTVLNLVTESKDVVDAVYLALPAYRRPRRLVSPQEKAALIYKHFAELDPAIAVKELIKNQAEDALFGKVGKLQGKANRAGSGKYNRLQIGLGPAL